MSDLGRRGFLLRTGLALSAAILADASSRAFADQQLPPHRLQELGMIFGRSFHCLGGLSISPRFFSRPIRHRYAKRSNGIAPALMPTPSAIGTCMKKNKKRRFYRPRLII